MKQNIYVSTPTMSPITATAAAAGGGGGCGSDDVGDELVPMLCLYYDADDTRRDRQKHGYLTANKCFNQCVSPLHRHSL